jgi:hypothetical protein
MRKKVRVAMLHPAREALNRTLLAFPIPPGARRIERAEP